MSMYVKYGQYQHADGECHVRIFPEVGTTRGGLVYEHNIRWEITGSLQAADQSALFTAITNLQTAYSTHGLDIGLYKSDGTLTPHYINASNCIGGTRVTKPPTFSESRNAELSTFRTYEIAIEAKVIDTRIHLTEWEESLEFFGGGQATGYVEPIEEVPIKQVIRNHSVYKALQQGRAVGMLEYPSPPPLLWPADIVRPQIRVKKDTANRMGPFGSPVFIGYPISWSYYYESASPLLGDPTPWPEV